MRPRTTTLRAAQEAYDSLTPPEEVRDDSVNEIEREPSEDGE